VLRTAQSVVVTDETSIGGWLTWTPMNSSPAIAAEIPAARVSLVAVMVIRGCFVPMRPGVELILRLLHEVYDVHLRCGQARCTLYTCQGWTSVRL
jgi:hypothetical protein